MQPASRMAAAVAGMQGMSMASGYPAPQGPPPGMHAASIADSRSLPRPSLTGATVAVRIATGDPPVKAPAPDPPAAFPNPLTGGVRTHMAVEPAACPPEIFVPVSPRALRLCNGAFPMTSVLARKYAMPFGAVVQPLAKPGPDEDPVPVVNFSGSGIVRCRRCRSYINFSCSFRDGGRHWICSMCSYKNDVASDYFSPLDANGKRVDAAQRPELHRGSVEFVAPAEYMVRPPMPPVYLFVLEVTPAAVSSGALAAAIAGIKNSIDSMPNEGRTRVGIVTFDSAVQFYTMSSGPDAEPAVFVVSDINDIFLPTPESIMVQLSECRPCFERALDMIGSSHVHANGIVSAASCLGAGLKGAQKALEFTGGKLLMFAASRPTIGPGALRERGDNSMLGSDRERAILKPDNSLYSQIAVSMAKYQISVDLFLFPPPPGHYVDVASLAQLVKFTGGELFFCPSFDAPKDAPRLQLAINRTLARETGLEAVMRIRATKSVRCTHFSGRFFVRSTDLLAMANVDSDKAYAVQFTFDETNIGEGPFCLQVALLYTTTSGERRIRVHTVAIPVSDSLIDLFMRADAPATTNIFVRLAADGMKDRMLGELKKSLTDKVVSALAKYREVCQSQYPDVIGNTQLLIPNSISLMPLYMHGLGKTPILSQDACGAFLYKFDDKAALFHAVDVMNVAETCAMVYPNIIPVYSGPASNRNVMKHPDGSPATVASLNPNSGVLIDDGRSLILWLGSGILQPFTTEVLGSSVTGPVDPRLLVVELMRRGGSAKGAVGQVYNAVKSILSSRKPALPLHIVPAGDQRMQVRVEALMTEDRTSTTTNYREFLLEMRRQVAHRTAKK